MVPKVVPMALPVLTLVQMVETDEPVPCQAIEEQYFGVLLPLLEVTCEYRQWGLTIAWPAPPQLLLLPPRLEHSALALLSTELDLLQPFLGP